MENLVPNVILRFRYGAMIPVQSIVDKETANIIASYAGIDKLIIEDNLIERDYGRLSGLTPDGREKFYASGQNDEMESWDDLNQRVLKVLNYYSKNAGYKNITWCCNQHNTRSIIKRFNNMIL
jgi:broad specificity phosphatase PhoE